MLIKLTPEVYINPIDISAISKNHDERIEVRMISGQNWWVYPRDELTLQETFEIIVKEVADAHTTSELNRRSCNC